MERRNARNSPGLPPALLGATPRRTRPSVVGAQVLILAVVQLVAGLWWGIEIYRSAPVNPAAIWSMLGIPAASMAVFAFLIALVRRQADLLAYGRPAVAVVTKVEKKRTDTGAYWRVQYEWTLLSGARRQAYCTRTPPPVVGSVLPIIYDRDRPSRNRTYPFPLVALSGK